MRRMLTDKTLASSENSVATVGHSLEYSATFG
jgi:hypothetical protein